MNLFWKLFATLGIAMALTLVLAIFVTFRLTSLAFDQFNIENREITIERAAAALVSGGRDELVDWLRSNPTLAPGIEVLVLDQSRQDLLGREVPAWMRRALGPEFRNEGRRPRNFRPPRFAATLVAPSGEEYQLLFVRTQITLLGLLTWPATQVAVLILAITAAAATSLVLARYLASPIEKLQRATRALAAGSLDARVGFPFSRRRDEVGTLARDFDAMAARIQALVTAKETLLRDVSHELRSPLARIRVALALAQRKANDPAQSDLARIEHEAERLDDLVGQILTLARIRSESPASLEQVDIGELAAEVVEDVEFEADDAVIDLTAEAVPSVSGQPGELKSALENVLRNAVIHTPAGGHIGLSVREASGNVEICVRDQGPGVDAAQLDRIFEPFFRADASRDHKREGFGLGLAIAAGVVARHDGRITARNVDGGGLEICMELPLERSANGPSTTPQGEPT